MITIKEYHNCCGCAACVQACPRHCISLKPDFEGFEYPKVDKAICIECGLCEKVCPIINMKSDKQKMVEDGVYISYTTNEFIRMASSSGGIFTLLADEIINLGGIVFGAAFDDEFLVHHIGVECKKDLSKLQGSKYLQSRIENTYIEARHALENKRKVLFSGTACQIAGLKKFLKRDYENLVTVDVLCHGVPSPKVWKCYLSEQEKKHGSRVKNVFFRFKKYGWKNYSVLLEFYNNKVYECVYTQDNFMKVFLENMCLRPSCHKCKFKEMDRPSDITLGDCWGIEQHSPELDDDKGISFVMEHTDKGKAMIESIMEHMILKKGILDIILPQDADSRKSVAVNPNRRFFFALLSIVGFENIVKIICLMNRIKQKIKYILKRVEC